MKGTCYRSLEKSTATLCKYAFSYMPSAHAYCCRLRCSMYLLVCLRCPFFSYSYWCYCWLLINSCMYICVSATFVLFLFMWTILGRTTQQYICNVRLDVFISVCLHCQFFSYSYWCYCWLLINGCMYICIRLIFVLFLFMWTILGRTT